MPIAGAIDPRSGNRRPNRRYPRRAWHADAHRPRELRADLWQSSSRPAKAFWTTIWDFCGAVGERGDMVLENGDCKCRGPLVPAGPPELRRKPAAKPRRRRGAGVLGRGQGQAADEPRRAGYAEVATCFRLFLRRWRWRRRPCCRLPAQPAGNPGRHAGGHRARCHLVPASPDFGVQGVLDRFGQIGRKCLLICVDGYWYNGKPVDCLGTSKRTPRSSPKCLRW